jgi:D-aspartate ligase
VPDPRIDEQSFLNRLIDLSKIYKGSLLIPTDDYTLETFSKHKEVLEPHYVVAAKDYEIVKQLIHKEYTYAIADSLGVLCPTTVTVESSEQLQSKLGSITYPCLIKPCEGHKFYDHFKEKMFKVNNEQELLSKYSQMETLGLTGMVQEIIPGDDTEGVNYNSYFVKGAPIAEFTAKKVRIDPPFFGSPRVIMSKKIPEIIEPGRLLLSELGYEGFSCMEFKRDVRDGTYKLMEVNCRNNLSGSLAVYCGINFPWIMYRHHLYGEVHAHKQWAFKENIYWIDITKDIYRFCVSRKEEGYSLKEYLRPYFHEKVFAILSASDPLPFLKRLYYMLIAGFGKLLRSGKSATAN